jgi:hypothetical protein
MPTHPTRTLVALAAMLVAPRLLAQPAPVAPAPEPAEPAAAPSPDDAAAGTAAPAPATPTAAPTTAAAEVPPLATAATAEPTAVLQPAPAAAAPAAAEAAAPKQLAVGKRATFQPGLLVQAWAQIASQGVADGPDTTHSFRVRRAELKAKGEIIPDRVAYSLMIDAAKTLRFGRGTVPVENQDPPATDPEAPEQVEVLTAPADTSLLQDAVITFLSDTADLSVGQFKPPIGLESTTSSSKLLFPERARATRVFADRRDVGLRVDKQFKRFGYAVGLFNGQGLNAIDRDLQKDAVLRLEVRPLEGLNLGLSGYAGVGERDSAGTRDRLEGDFRLEVSDALLQGEYFLGRTGPDGDGVTAQGAYGLAGYTFADRCQPVVRVGFVDVDMDEPNTLTRHYEVGFNYYALENQLKFQAAYALIDTDEGDDIPRHEGTLAVQVSY